jgi:hypothetical protein
LSHLQKIFSRTSVPITKSTLQYTYIFSHVEQHSTVHMPLI